eukprot:gnl/TRDRNA2_/TRDRNA2_143359_c0_seq1.p1 gnl/TRDRNA2_/TRDRNA2_143359_c0~~gnl/TRDRNA2_/TRDRNA2_143359_c0_seq1.p1  ORF type:complete len:166 (+),score=33.25 gnl/TRDRNA2_/TRDRNA2_143359_c0_seq1:149-646(+)
MPKWWLLKDTDTYVNMPRLAAAAADYDPEKPAMLAHMCGSACGGGGLLFSRSLVEKLVGEFGDRMVEFMKQEIIREAFYWDGHSPQFVGWVPGAKTLDVPFLQTVAPLLEGMCLPKRGWTPGPDCKKVSICLCSRSTTPATWHLRDSPSFDRAIAVLDKYYGLTP